jgi:hypothetical protein
MNEEDALNANDLVPAEGGDWKGLLFDNPRIGIAPALTWGFRFPFNGVTRHYGESPVSLDIEWVVLTTGSWQAMSGRTARTAHFAEPGEASVYYFQHHRYDAIDLQVIEQQGPNIHVLATVSGDLDGLGLASVTADHWLRFTGINVSLSDTTSAETALARLQDFTDASGLAHSPTPTNTSFRFAPANL